MSLKYFGRLFLFLMIAGVLLASWRTELYAQNSETGAQPAAPLVDAVYLKDVLGGINANSDNRHRNKRV